MKKTIEIIVPCYNEAEVLPIFFQTVCNISEKIDKYEFSFLFIDDGSIDNTLEIIKNFQLKKHKYDICHWQEILERKQQCWQGLIMP